MFSRVLVFLLFAGFTAGLMDKCKYHEFDCDRNKRCVPFEKHCDGIADCEDKTDEDSCMYVYSTDSPKLRQRDKVADEDFTERLAEIDNDELFWFHRVIIVVIIGLLMGCLVGILGFLYRKRNFSKPKTTSFNNPIYHTTTEDASKESDELAL